MSYTSLNPKQDIDPFLEIKPLDSYPEELLKDIKLLSFFPDGPHPMGSYKYSIQKWPSDVDLIETFEDCCTKDEVIKKFIKKLKQIVKDISKRKEHYFSEFKAGLDNRYDVDIGECRNGYYNINPELKDMSLKLFENRLFNKDEITQILTIINDNIIDGDAYDTIFNIYRNRRILRWSAKEILQGFKNVDGTKIPLSKALHDNTLVKIDMISLVENNFIEITNFIILYLTNQSGQKHEYIGYNIESNPPLDALPREIEKLYFSNYYYSPFKMIKRLFSLVSKTRDIEILQKIIPIISSDVALLYQLKSQIEVLLRILKIIKNPPMKKISEQLDKMKTRISNILQFNNTEKQNIYNLIKKVNSSSTQIYKKMGILYFINHNIFNPKINYLSITYLNEVNLNPPPSLFLPFDMIYALITRSPNDNPTIDFYDNGIDIYVDELEKDIPSKQVINKQNKKIDNFIKKHIQIKNVEQINPSKKEKAVQMLIEQYPKILNEDNPFYPINNFLSMEESILESEEESILESEEESVEEPVLEPPYVRQDFRTQEENDLLAELLLDDRELLYDPFQIEDQENLEYPYDHLDDEISLDNLEMYGLEYLLNPGEFTNFELQDLFYKVKNASPDDKEKIVYLMAQFKTEDQVNNGINFIEQMLNERDSSIIEYNNTKFEDIEFDEPKLDTTTQEIVIDNALSAYRLLRLKDIDILTDNEIDELANTLLSTRTDRDIDIIINFIKELRSQDEIERLVIKLPNNRADIFEKLLPNEANEVFKYIDNEEPINFFNLENEELKNEQSTEEELENFFNIENERSTEEELENFFNIENKQSTEEESTEEEQTEEEIYLDPELLRQNELLYQGIEEPERQIKISSGLVYPFINRNPSLPYDAFPNKIRI